MNKILTLLALAFVFSTAHATPFNEVGDAGDLPGSANMLTAGTDSILGSLIGMPMDGDDVDLYGFDWSGGLFEAEVISADFDDSQLFIFDAAGMIIGLDDDGGAGLLSLFSDTLAAGSYFMAISRWDNDPLNAAGDQIDSCFTSMSGCGGDLILAGWTGADDSGGNYEIALNALVGMAIPEPGTLVLVGVGLLGIALRRRTTDRLIHST